MDYSFFLHLHLFIFTLLLLFLLLGIVVAVLGCETISGKFEVEDYCFPGLPPHYVPAPLTAHDNDQCVITCKRQHVRVHVLTTPTRYLILVSGLNIGSPWSDRLAIQMFIDLVSGQLCSTAVRTPVCAHHLKSLCHTGTVATD